MAPGADGGTARGKATHAGAPASPGSPASPEDFNRVVQEARAGARVRVFALIKAGL